MQSLNTATVVYAASRCSSISGESPCCNTTRCGAQAILSGRCVIITRVSPSTVTVELGRHVKIGMTLVHEHMLEFGA
jgi:hypothetical protein